MSFFSKPLQLVRRVRRFTIQSGNTNHETQVLSTLNPGALQPSDYLDLSGLHFRYIAFEPATKGLNPALYYDKPARGVFPKFPPQSAGFLYFLRAPDDRPLEGTLRFRLSADERPSSFDTGKDLLLPTGLPWKQLLPQLLHVKLRKVGAQLLRENIVTETEISRCHQVFGKGRKIPPSATTLFHLGQEFPVDFSIDPTVHIVADSLLRVQFAAFSYQTWPSVKRIWPWTGTGLARLEPTGVDGRRFVQMRITKILTPVVCSSPEHLGHIVEPKEGALITVFHSQVGVPRPWLCDIDRKNRRAAALRTLWPTNDLP
ncbi:hypothetical protein C8R46DRAFT_1065351 [Mycena filopes]|nr:hypothetical protein C8R46DRAFT_1128270 [Mycena filopes]KAJ7184868.1 hypothetical protein C8R46DRAFT_1065351 [Mycena filopes]